MKGPKWTGLPIPDADNCALAKRVIDGETIASIAKSIDRSPTQVRNRLIRFARKYTGFEPQEGAVTPPKSVLAEAAEAYESPTDDLQDQIRRLPTYVQRRLTNAGIRTREDILHLGRYGFLGWRSFGEKCTDLVGSLVGGWPPDPPPPKTDLKAVPTEQLIRELRRRKALRTITLRGVLVKLPSGGKAET